MCVRVTACQERWKLEGWLLVPLTCADPDSSKESTRETGTVNALKCLTGTRLAGSMVRWDTLVLQQEDSRGTLETACKSAARASKGRVSAPSMTIRVPGPQTVVILARSLRISENPAASVTSWLTQLHNPPPLLSKKRKMIMAITGAPSLTKASPTRLGVG